MDKMLKLTSLQSNSTLQRYDKLSVIHSLPNGTVWIFSALCCDCNSDDTLASFRCLFLVPVNWCQILVSLSYFS